MPLHRLRRLRERPDSGTSIVEIAVSMMVFSILLIACGTLYITSIRSVGSTNARLVETQDAKIAISAMSRSLRTAILPSQLYDTSSSTEAAFILATPNLIQFYANIDNPNNTIGPTKVTYKVAGGVLTQTAQKPLPRVGTSKAFIYCDPNLPTCATSTKVLARGVVTSGAPLFRYYDALGVQLTGATLTAAQLEVVDAVDVSVTVSQQKTRFSDGTTYVLRIALPNHDAVVRAENEG